MLNSELVVMEESHTDRVSPADRLFLLLLAAVLLLTPLLTLLRWRNGASFYEQRMLAEAPEITGESLWSGQLFTDTESALSDHLPLRDRLLKADTRLDLALGRPKVNDLVVNTDVLLSVNGYFRGGLGNLADKAGETAARYAGLDALVRSCGGYFCYMGLPLQFTYFSDRYPAYMENRTWCTDPIRDAFSAAMEDADVPFLNMYALFQAQGMPEAFYFRTDHHFTCEGAFAARDALMSRLERDVPALLSAPLTRGDYIRTALPNPFLGSSNRRLYGLWENDDHLEIAEPKAAISFTRTDNGAAAAPSVFALPEDDTGAVTYSVYMGGDIGETVIDTNRPHLPSLLIYGDSFTNALETLLWADFDETRSLDFRCYDGSSLTDYIRKYRPDVVVCVRDESVFLSPEGNGTTD